MFSKACSSLSGWRKTFIPSGDWIHLQVFNEVLIMCQLNLKQTVRSIFFFIISQLNPLNPELFQKVVTHTLSYFHTACKKVVRHHESHIMSEKQYFYFWQIILNSPDSMLQIDIQFANYFPSSPSKIMMETWNSASRVFFLYHWLFIWSPTLYW